MGQICHPARGCNCNWRLSAPRGDKRLSEPGGVRAEPVLVQGLPARLLYPRRTVQQAGVFTRGSSLSLLLQGLCFAAGMKLVPFALMYLGSLVFLGVETAPLDVASEFRKK